MKNMVWSGQNSPQQTFHNQFWSFWAGLYCKVRRQSGKNCPTSKGNFVLSYSLYNADLNLGKVLLNSEKGLKPQACPQKEVDKRSSSTFFHFRSLLVLPFLTLLSLISSLFAGSFCRNPFAAECFRSLVTKNRCVFCLL